MPVRSRVLALLCFALLLPVAARALECYDEASRAGFGGDDGAMLPVRWVQGTRK